jgi:hypothetical protein
MSKAPPVKDRPKCPACSRPLKPNMTPRFWSDPERRAIEPSKWTGTYKRYGAFCTLTCCDAYANEMYKRHGTTFVVARISLQTKEPQ